MLYVLDITKNSKDFYVPKHKNNSIMAKSIMLTGIRIKCPNTFCNYEWEYKGRFFLYATCPSCRRNVKITENKTECALQSGKVDRPTQIAGIDNTSGADILRQ
jgi:hypothetical protein